MNYENAQAPQPGKHMYKQELENTMSRGISWFFWIFGLSIINTLIINFGGDISFIVGLGITQIVDGIILEIGKESGESLVYIALIINIFISGIFLLFGILGKKGHDWAVILGIVFYSLDALIFLLVFDILSIAFHGFALFQIIKGYKALNELKRMNSVDVFQNQVAQENL